MILLGNQTAGSWQKHLHQFWHTSDDSKGAERRFLSNVRVWRLHQSLHLGRQIPRHFRRRNCTEGTQRQTNDELCRTIQVTVREQKKTEEIKIRFQKCRVLMCEIKRALLFQTIRNQEMYVLSLIQ